MFFIHYVVLAEERMDNVASATRNITDIDESFDGTWQRRGYCMINGVVTCIESTNNKCIYIDIKRKDCKSCILEKEREIQLFPNIICFG